jgi:hypothetical protein
MVSFEHFGFFRCRADGPLAADADTLAATDALLNNPNGLFVFDPDGFSRADRQTCAPTGTEVFFKIHKAG